MLDNTFLFSAKTKKETIGDLDIASLLKYIEGGKKGECKDSKKAAKRARQKQKKQKEKEKQEQEEVQKKRVDATKNQVTISVVNENKRLVNSCFLKNLGLSAVQSLFHFIFYRANNVKPNIEPPKQQPQQRFQPQTLNLAGLKSLVEKSDPNSVPKMVTIRRVMAPFSAEPTVTITLKGSTPDKDKVLFMLKNGNDTCK